MEDEEYLAKTKERLISSLIKHKFLRSSRAIKAFEKVPREEFVLPQYRSNAYSDTPLPILESQTISACHMCCIMIEEDCLDPQVGDRVLEIGTGSGYHAALLAEMVALEGCENPGHVWTIEIHKKLVEFARENLERAGYSNRVTVIHGDGSKGYPPEAPYDCIMVTAAAPDIPDPLKEQLKIGGRLVIPVGTPHLWQELILLIKKEDGSLKTKNLGGVAFVPLRGKYGFK
ncbi:MAG: protein-L-isoaspartate(D-aspartate) O-methyltransferase [Candidatus Hodarchaeota archaeon]